MFTHNDLQNKGLPQLYLSEAPVEFFLILETAAVLIYFYLIL